MSDIVNYEVESKLLDAGWKEAELEIDFDSKVETLAYLSDKQKFTLD